MDEELRDLERRAAAGDPRADEALAHLHVRLGRGWRGEVLPASIRPARMRGHYAWGDATLLGAARGWRWLEGALPVDVLAVGDEVVACLAVPAVADVDFARAIDRVVVELRGRAVRWIVLDAALLTDVAQSAVEASWRHGLELRAVGGGAPIVGLPERWRQPFDLLELGTVLDHLATLDDALALIERSAKSPRPPARWTPPPDLFRSLQGPFLLGSGDP
jgi:hypothetical protein